MVAIERSVIRKQSTKEILEVVKTEYGILLLKSRAFLDGTAQFRVYKVSFDEMGEMISSGNKSVIVTDSVLNFRLKDFHHKNTELLTSEHINQIESLS